jgi:hypothetical protein
MTMLLSRLAIVGGSVALAFGLVVFGGPTFVGPAAAECGFNEDGEWVCDGGDNDSGDPGDPGGPSGPSTPRPYDTYATPACLYNGPPPNDPGAMCTNAAQACELRGEEGILMRYYVQWEQGGPWELIDTRCSGGTDEPDPVTPEQVRAWLESGWLPEANVGVSPGNGRTLLNFPTIFYTEARDYNETRDIPGGQLQVVAEQVGFIWKWGDGTSDTTSTAGRPYSPGTDQSAYVTHEYPTPGTYTVDVDVQWSARANIPGLGWQDLGTITVTRGDTAPITVLSKNDVLER